MNIRFPIALGCGVYLFLNAVAIMVFTANPTPKEENISGVMMLVGICLVSFSVVKEK